MTSRGVFHQFVTEEVCRELVFIHRSIGVVGYRPHVKSTTLFDLVLADPRLLPAVVRVRQLVWDCIEDHFDKPCQVYVEHTSLISWHAGASISWHHDANRDYLSQRHFSAVLYLNTQDQDFSGGTFCFQSGPQPLRIAPAAGTLLVYTADDSNVHQVEEVTAGERVTLTMWFTLEEAFQEDRKVLSQLSHVKEGTCQQDCGLPETMYQQGPDGPDIRMQQLQQLGLRLVCLHQQEAEAEQQQQQPPTWQLRATAASGKQQTNDAMSSAEADENPEVVAQFNRLQEAYLTLNFLLWMLSPRPQPSAAAVSASGSRRHWSRWMPDSNCNLKATGSQEVSDAVRCAARTPQSTSGQSLVVKQPHQRCLCWHSKDNFSQASLMLQEYLAEAEVHLRQLLLVWREHEALVMTLHQVVDR